MDFKAKPFATDFKPKCFATWLTLKLVFHNIEDADMAKAIGCHVVTLSGWKSKSNLPKMKYILSVADFISKTTGEAPSDIVDEMLNSMHEYRKINKEYRVRKKAQSDM